MANRKTSASIAAVVAGAASIALYRTRLRPWMYTGGAVANEVGQVLPGDELVATDALRTTRALTIDAPPTSVWPWLVQIGEDRAGFYSYSLLERAVGAQIHNADAVHPEWLNIGVGDTIWLARRYGERSSLVVAAVQPGSHLILMSPGDFNRMQRGERAEGAWSLHLLQRPEGGTRLLVRGSGGAVGHATFDIPHFIMEQKMMRGIRDRAQ